MPTKTLKEICGCIHLHTTFSDGGCDYGTIIDAADDARLDYICVTDHDNLGGRHAGFEGLRDNGVFVLVGYEHNDDKHHNHYLAFGMDEIAYGLTDPKAYVDAIKATGGIGFLAHPAEKRNYIKSLPPYPWTRWDVEGFDGIEVWNQISDWMERLRGWHSLTRLLSPNKKIGDAPPELMERWDALNRQRFVSAIGGVDAHSRKFKWGPFSCVVFPIDVELRGVRMHLFVDEMDWYNASKAGGALISALRDGRGFMSNFSRGDAKGSKIVLIDGNGAVRYPGRCEPDDQSGAAEPSFPMKIKVELTHKAKIVLIHNGKPVQSAKAKSAEWEISEKGVYRIEAYRGTGAWIYSNPFPVGGYPL
ncbi:MAG: CehA/McbA family metallohydrolase [Chitinispirillales bacterium]|jgi:hypothetical protein|nr:CehA/McbA family metallohydrolase [Chitinispirillales bacterium]